MWMSISKPEKTPKNAKRTATYWKPKSTKYQNVSEMRPRILHLACQECRSIPPPSPHVSYATVYATFEMTLAFAIDNLLPARRWLATSGSGVLVYRRFAIEAVCEMFVRLTSRLVTGKHGIATHFVWFCVTVIALRHSYCIVTVIYT